ncbi:MAG: metallophosphoesterase family protein [Chloroflexi bacterium]|nr:metallophosphoesterase family protein [Chloroflexota bacterium]
MRIAVISDVHANCVAFDAVLADLQNQPVDSTVCLGDAIQGGPQPAQVVARLSELACPVVMGNADAWLLTGVDTGHEAITSKQRTIREWSLSQLSDGDRAFIASFLPTVEMRLPDHRKLLCFHGSPDSFDDVIAPQAAEDEFKRFLGKYSAWILAGGHTHAQQVRRNGDNFFFNPGSVGLAYRHDQDENNFRADPWAEYAVLQIENGRMSLEFRRVPFDVQELVHVYRTSGRPYAEDTIRQYQS